MAKEIPGQTLQPTALVHEAWLRLTGNEDVKWNGRAHFFGAAAEAMRRILIENARRKSAQRHGGGQQRVDIQDIEIPFAVPDDELLALHEALDKLAAQDPAKAELVKLRYFVGLTIEEAAEILKVDAAFGKRLSDLRNKLPVFETGKHGQLREWLEDYDEPEPGHRHMSHLFALHPGNRITPRGSPDLAKAARISLERRLANGGGQTGWSQAWVINFWARPGVPFSAAGKRASSRYAQGVEMPKPGWIRKKLAPRKARKSSSEATCSPRPGPSPLE